MSRKSEAVRVMARLPQEQKLWIEEQAERNFTSQNAEIVRSIRSRMESQQQPERAAG
jgi:hypothetical protein